MVFQALNRLKWQGKLNGTEIIILSRGSPENKMEIKGGEVIEIKKTYLIFSEAGKETFIPLHRVLEVRKARTLLWSRKSAKQE